MAGLTPRSFGYAHSHAVMEGLKAFVCTKNCRIHDGYDFIEKPGEHKEFDKMIALAKECGQDILHVDTVKEFAGQSLSDFKDAIIAIEDAGMLVCSLTEPTYDYGNFMTIIELLESFMPGYQKQRRKIEAVTMCRLDIEMEEICRMTGLGEADVFQAVADYKREQEQAKR